MSETREATQFRVRLYKETAAYYAERCPLVAELVQEHADALAAELADG